ncbi:adhesion G-protein coupled receptor G5-like, partial [Clarias magur]
MAAVLVPVEEAELTHVALVRTSVGACLRGHLKTSARTVVLKLLNTDRCLSQIQGALAQGGVCVERVLQPVGVYRTRFLMGLLWDWMPEGSLHSLLYETQLFPDVPLVLRLRVLLDVAEGFHALHAASLPHGALKTTNVLLDQQYRAKLCDWGQQTSVEVRSRVSDARDLAFLAPEVLLGNALSARADVYSFGVLMWETLNRGLPCEDFDQLQNLITCARAGAEPDVEMNLLPPDAPQSHALSQLMTRCWCSDPKQRPLAEECVLELRKVLEALEPGAHCAAVQLIKTCKERALLSCKHSPDWELHIELNNLQGHSGCTDPKYAMSKSIPVTVLCSSRHPARAHKPDKTIRRGSAPVPTSTRASPPTPCCRGVSSHTARSSSSSCPGVGRCAGVHPTRSSTPPNTPSGSPTSPIHPPLHPAHQ